MDQLSASSFTSYVSLNHGIMAAKVGIKWHIKGNRCLNFGPAVPDLLQNREGSQHCVELGVGTSKLSLLKMAVFFVFIQKNIPL